MLETLRVSPEDTGSSISWGDRLDTNCYIFSLFSLDYIMMKYLYRLLFNQLKLTFMDVFFNSILSNFTDKIKSLFGVHCGYIYYLFHLKDTTPLVSTS